MQTFLDSPRISHCTGAAPRVRRCWIPHLLSICVLVLTACGGGSGGSSSSSSAICTVDQATGTTIDKQPFISGGYSAQWNGTTNRIAYMQPDSLGYYQIYTMAAPMSVDGAATGTAQALNATHPGIPTGVHQGIPMWSASGNYLMFISQKPTYSGSTLFGIPAYGALPGFGTHDDLWIAATDGSASWQLSNETDSTNQGILLPVFSPDGTQVAWTDRQTDGTYVIKVANFVTSPQPALGTTRSYTPGGAAYYEPGSFTSDGRGLLYTSDADTGSFWESQIYLLDLATGTHTRLTQDTHYNEHPIDVPTSNGDWIIYMSDANSVTYGLQRGTDWYAMRLDGSGAKRLTQMNVVGSSEYTGSLRVAGRVTMSPSGGFYLGDVQNSLTQQTGDSLVVRFTCP